MGRPKLKEEDKIAIMICNRDLIIIHRAPKGSLKCTELC